MAGQVPLVPAVARNDVALTQRRSPVRNAPGGAIRNSRISAQKIRISPSFFLTDGGFLSSGEIPDRRFLAYDAIVA
jgi:hypothetical protein